MLLDNEQLLNILEGATSTQLRYIYARLGGATNSSKAATVIGLNRASPFNWANLAELETVIKTIQIRQIEMMYHHPVIFEGRDMKRAWIESIQKMLFKTLTDMYPEKKDNHDFVDQSGFVYVLRSIEHSYFKIGMSKDPNRRLEMIQPALPFSTEVICVIGVEDRYAAESFLHNQFKSKRANGEWFLLSADDLVWIRQWGKQQGK